MYTSGKRTFSQFRGLQDTNSNNSIDIDLDLSQSPPKAKKQRLNTSSSHFESRNRSRSPSIEILSFHPATQSIAPPLKSEIVPTNDNKENKGDTNNSTGSNSVPESVDPAQETNNDWVNDEQCIIQKHRLQNEWYYFKVVHRHNENQYKWLKHTALQHLNVYKQYMKQKKLSLDEVSEAQYIPQNILNHEFYEEEDTLFFYISWKNYSQEFNSWEPAIHLRDNDLYIEYCKKHNIKPLLTDFSDEDEEEDDDEDDDEHTVFEIEEVDDESDDIVHSPSRIDDINHIESVYNAAKRQQRALSIEDIESLIANIDLKTLSAINSNEHKQCNNHNNCDDAKKDSEIDLDLLLNKLFDIREYFDAMRHKQLRNNTSHTAPDIQMNDNSIKTPAKKKKKRTLFDYAFTPTPSKSKPRMNIKPAVTQSAQIKPKASNKTKKSMKQSHIIDISEYDPNESEQEEIIPNEYIQQRCSCYGCKRRWPLYGVEYFKSFPICKQCPKHIRIGYNRKFKEDWFCPYCIHSAHRTFSLHSLTNICAARDKPFLYVKPNGSNYWKTYIPLKVLDVQRKVLRVERKQRGKAIDITLADIPQQNILWAYHDKKETIRKNNDIHDVKVTNDDMVVITLKKKKKTPLKVPRYEVINCSLYLDELMLQMMRVHKQRRITFDRERIFKHSRRMMLDRRQKEREKYQFGANTKVIESAQVNSRYFDEHDSNSMEAEKTIPLHPQTTAQLLSTFGVSSVPENFVKPPERHLVLSNIARYSLVLIVGPSGSGKSTLLKDLQSQNPSMVTFKSPSCLSWDNTKCVISQFGDISVEEAMTNMSSIGLNNVRTWLKPFNILSQGEQYRCAFARLLQQSKEEPDKIIIMDEFTSVLDRINARCMSAATSKCIRKNNRNKHKKSTFVLASANEDIIRYLQPDLLILLGNDNGMKCIENPNDVNNNKSLFDVKSILDLPPFRRKKEDGEYECKSIHPLTMFDDLVPFTEPINVSKEVRELKCKVQMDAHATQTSRILDVEDFTGECITHIPCLQRQHLRSEFNIGVIVGPSGCGKTSSGERLFGRPQSVQWDNTRNIASHFQSVGDLKELFVSVDLPLNIGFSRFEYLSEGEQHRINIARYLQDDNVLIDEFTSYLDRECAKKVAKGVSDYIYKHNKKNVVFLCCKYDVISATNGLHPSWIFDVPNKKLTHYRQPSERYISDLRSIQPTDMENVSLYATHQYIHVENLWNPPKIRLVLKPATIRDFYPTFSKYHYMDAKITTSAKCWSVWAYFSYSRSGNHNNNGDKSKKRSDKEEASDDDDAVMINTDENDEGYYDENELELAGFISILNHYGQNKVSTPQGPKIMHYREHRTVILPSFQSLGFGSRIADCLGEYLSAHSLRLHSKTAHPRYGGYRNKEPSLWIPTNNNGVRQSKKAWKKNTERIIFANRERKAVGHEKLYFVHLFKLHSERTDKVNQKLKSRVIVKKQYEKL